VGQDGILRADGIGAVQTVQLIGNRPVDNRLFENPVPSLTLRVIRTANPVCADGLRHCS
jgi:hypothetical protein